MKNLYIVILLIAFILFPSILLSYICVNLTLPSFYIWLIVLLVGVIIISSISIFIFAKRILVLAQKRSDFVSNISHELKTPLTSINMFTEMLILNLYKNETEKEEFLNIIRKECNRLIGLVDKILDFSKIEKGKMEFRLEQESINDVILYSVQIFKAQMPEENCKISLNLENDLPKLQIDKSAITEVLLNLLSNAEKYSKEEKEIIINSKANKNYVVVEVIDNGIGIPRKYHKKIFEPFYRIDNPLSKEVKGAGLGLSYVKHIVIAHGGKIEVQSEVGNGSKFTLFLPYSKRGRRWLKF